MRLAMLLSLVLGTPGLSGCGGEEFQEGWIQVTNAVAHTLEYIRWKDHFVSHDASKVMAADTHLDHGETGHVQILKGYLHWDEPGRFIFMLSNDTTWSTAEEVLAKEGGTVTFIIDDDTQVFECDNPAGASLDECNPKQ